MLDNPLIRIEFDKIINTPLSDVLWKLEAIVVANGIRLKLPNVYTKETIRDYETQFGDEIFLTAQVGLTTFQDYILPYKDDLKVDVVRTLLDGNGNEIPSALQEKETYTAFLLDPPNLDLMAPSRGYENKQINELSQLIDINFQLIDPRLNEMRMADVAGIYRNPRNQGGIRLDSLIKRLYSYDASETLSGATLESENFKGVRGVDVVPIHNVKSYGNLVIPTGTRLTQIVKYLQKTYGIYQTGVNRYYQDGRWFIYPLYDHLRYKKSKKRLTILNIPKDELVAPERSFNVRDDNVTILATGNTLVLDQTENIAANQGTGLRFTKASTLIDGMQTATGNKSTPNTANTNQGFAIQEKPGGLTNARHSSRGVTDNPYAEASELSKGLGYITTVSWANAKPKYLYPGMPVKMLYGKEGEVREVYGTLLGVRISETPSTARLTDNTYLTNCSLVLHLQKI